MPLLVHRASQFCPELVLRFSFFKKILIMPGSSLLLCNILCSGPIYHFMIICIYYLFPLLVNFVLFCFVVLNFILHIDEDEGF